MKSKYSRAPGETENITGLLGGTAFYKRVNEHIQMEKIDGTGGLYCSVYFNLTNFKLYNSNYGIEQGDESLPEGGGRTARAFSVLHHRPLECR